MVKKFATRAYFAFCCFALVFILFAAGGLIYKAGQESTMIKLVSGH